MSGILILQKCMTSREGCPAHSTLLAQDRGDGRESNLAAVPQHHAGAGRQAGGEKKGRRPGTGKVAALIPMKLSLLPHCADWIYHRPLVLSLHGVSKVEC